MENSIKLCMKFKMSVTRFRGLEDGVTIVVREGFRTHSLYQTCFAGCLGFLNVELKHHLCPRQWITWDDCFKCRCPGGRRGPLMTFRISSTPWMYALMSSWLQIISCLEHWKPLEHDNKSWEEPWRSPDWRYQEFLVLGVVLPPLSIHWS